MARSSKTKKRPAGGSIDTLPSGALRVRVDGGIDPVSKRRYRPTEVIPAGPDAEARANAALIRMLNEVNERRHPKTNATLNQLLDRYFDLIDVQRNTLTRYRELADLHIRPLIGEQKAGRVDGGILDSLYAELRRCQVHCRGRRFIDHRTPRKHDCDHRCGPHRCTPLGPGTVRKVHYILSGAYKKAVYWGWLTVNPIDQAEAPAAALANPQPPSAADAATILNRAWYDDPDWGTQVWLSMVTGSRRGEVCALRWRHIDLENGVIHTEKAIAQDGTEIWEKDTKTHQDRRIVLDAETVVLLTEHWERCVARARTLGFELPKDAYVFSGEPDCSQPLKPRSVTQRYRRMVQRLDIDTHLHALRHYSATELIAAGVDIRTVAGRLGHGGGGSTTLRVYAAWLSEADQRAASSLFTRMPPRPAVVDPTEHAKTNPQAPYEKIAAAIRREILDSTLADGEPAPTVKQLAETHGVVTATAHRAHTLLRTWGLVSEGGRSHRSTIIRPALDEPAAPPVTDTTPAPTGATLLDLRLLCPGNEVRAFTAKADPRDPDQLHRLLAGAAHRHGGTDANLSNYELEVRQNGSPELVTTFVAF